MGFVSGLLYALLMNGVPLIEVIWSERSPAVLLLLYWFETVLLLVTGAIRIVLHRRATMKAGHFLSMQTISDHHLGAEATRRELADQNAYLRSFLGFTVIFTIVHGVFVLLLVFLFRVAGPLTWEEARAALVYVICVQSFFLFWDIARLRQWSFAELSRSLGVVSMRVLITQLGLIFGFVVMGITGSAWGLLGTFVALRAFGDACFGWLEGFIKRRDLPPGLAHVLSRTSKQSTATLEAEFDELKVRGAAVDALLERPISEVRPVIPAPTKP